MIGSTAVRRGGDPCGGEVTAGTAWGILGVDPALARWFGVHTLAKLGVDTLATLEAATGVLEVHPIFVPTLVATEKGESLTVQRMKLVRDLQR